MACTLSRALLVPCLSLALQASAAEVAVNAAREGDVLVIEASAEFDGTLARTWQVLTDYERLPEFIPNLRASRVVARAGDSITVEQKGEARVLFFRYPIEVRLAVLEFPPGRIVSRAIAGNFREMSSVYVLEASQGRVRLRYTGRLEPDFFVPPLLGTWALRHNVEASFEALVNEIVRRHKSGEQ